MNLYEKVRSIAQISLIAIIIFGAIATITLLIYGITACVPPAVPLPGIISLVAFILTDISSVVFGLACLIAWMSGDPRCINHYNEFSTNMFLRTEKKA